MDTVAQTQSYVESNLNDTIHRVEVIINGRVEAMNISRVANGGYERGGGGTYQAGDIDDS